MFLLEPQKTPYDLNFSVLGFPVRVHPLFWLFGLLSAGRADAKLIVTWLIVLFGSILLHELGHALMMRRFGRDAYVVLYMMGGLAIEGSPNPYGSSWNPRSQRRTPTEQIYISLAGPGIQLLLAGLIVVFVKGMGGDVGVRFVHYVVPVFEISRGSNISETAAGMLEMALWFNTWWAVVNLLPVYPLDGGQVALQLLTMRDPWGGQVRAIQLSIAAGAAMAIFALAVMGSMFTAMLFGSLAVSNYIAYMQIHGRGGNRW